ncbi:uncharacterized protein BDZ99DRAFT_514259 [Mytilinidion resinicola]|uniref:Uncharacterized protein n=1 Tax=Mytilinidion resinicola TaxID=574789 RepID=A0A6A6Z3C0_9PEZI|nr:uncharacterized protein BDZ99DRAFT_514259 [Mytilinidion resinicola]KAF2815596.1 hypothetical protein BDZ99DRAFT_514259 [Mytilinidion resinicola]
MRRAEIAEPNYRDTDPGPPFAQDFWDPLWLSPVLKAPEISIPGNAPAVVSGRDRAIKRIVRTEGSPSATTHCNQFYLSGSDHRRCSTFSRFRPSPSAHEHAKPAAVLTPSTSSYPTLHYQTIVPPLPRHHGSRDRLAPHTTRLRGSSRRWDHFIGLMRQVIEALRCGGYTDIHSVDFGTARVVPVATKKMGAGQGITAGIDVAAAILN